MTDPRLCAECGQPIPEFGPTGRRKQRIAKYCSYGPGACKDRNVQRRRYHRRKDTRPEVHAMVMKYNLIFRGEWGQRQRDAGKCVRCADGVPFAGVLCDDCMTQMGRLPA